MSFLVTLFQASSFKEPSLFKSYNREQKLPTVYKKETKPNHNTEGMSVTEKHRKSETTGNTFVCCIGFLLNQLSYFPKLLG